MTELQCLQVASTLPGGGCGALTCPQWCSCMPYLVHWESHCFCLLPQQLAAHCMHGYSVKPLVHSCQQPDNLHILPLPKCVEREGTVLPAAPRQPDTQRWRLVIAAHLRVERC